MLRSEFSYTLPEDLIAQVPRTRGASRMMLVNPARDPEIEHRSFQDFPGQLNPGDLLVLNDTRVFPARLFARPKGNMKNPIEILLTRELEPGRWEAWCRPARRVKPGDRLDFSETLHAEVEARSEGTVTLRFPLEARIFWNEIERIGVTPLPPYIKRPAARPEDRQSYQTVYAAEPGAIAAPTAGLHFTDEILAAITAKGIQIAPITLHVGIGTFKTVEAERIEDHRMDSERYEIPPSSAEAIRRAVHDRRRIVAVGTTTVRALESAWRAGNGSVREGKGETSIFIHPGFDFQVVSALLTNFHLPQSTLLMLISAFAGVETIRRAYREAIAKKYFFYSYGDCMFIRNEQ